jgi:DNA-binding HxlR family transcriptional regulator
LKYPHNFPYGVSLPNKIRFLFAKGAIETILYIEKNEKSGYYELYKQGYIVSRQAFSNLLKTLEENGITNRKVIENRPPRVEYTLTNKGKEIAALIKQLNEKI